MNIAEILTGIRDWVLEKISAIPKASNATITVKQTGRSDQTFTLNGNATTINLSDTNTHRPVQINGTEILGNNTTPLNIAGSNGITISNNTSGVTVSADVYQSKSATSGGTDLSLVTTGEKYTWNNKYTKPSDGIPKTDLSSEVQSSIDKADNNPWGGGVYSNSGGAHLKSLENGAYGNNAVAHAYCEIGKGTKTITSVNGNAITCDSGLMVDMTYVTDRGTIFVVLSKSDDVCYIDKNGNVAVGDTLRYIRGVAMGELSHAEGYLCSSIGYASHAEGKGSFAMAENSHAEGSATKAKFLNSHAEGYNTKALGEGSHSEGGNCQADGKYSHAEGSSTSTGDNNCHAEGYESSATGNTSHAEGSNTKAYGYNSHAQGKGTFAPGYGSDASGCFNFYTVSDSRSDINSLRSLRMLGIGTSSVDRRNAECVLSDGRIYLYNIGGYTGRDTMDGQDVASVISDIQQDLTINALTEEEINSFFESSDVGLPAWFITEDFLDYSEQDYLEEVGRFSSFGELVANRSAEDLVLNLGCQAMRYTDNIIEYEGESYGVYEIWARAADGTAQNTGYYGLVSVSNTTSIMRSNSLAVSETCTPAFAAKLGTDMEPYEDNPGNTYSILLVPDDQDWPF